MLVLSRKANQSIMIGSDIRIVIVSVDRDQVKLGIEAPRHVPVHRMEIFTEIHGEDASIASSTLAPVGKAAVEGDISGDADRN
ncbi:MAG: carbon storage regulator CsrA [Candidatus Cybelea sp.]